MILVYYTLVLFFGALGALGLLRTLEIAIFGGGSAPATTAAMGLLFTFLAHRMLLRARRLRGDAAAPGPGKSGHVP